MKKRIVAIETGQRVTHNGSLYYTVTFWQENNVHRHEKKFYFDVKKSSYIRARRAQLKLSGRFTMPSL